MASANFTSSQPVSRLAVAAARGQQNLLVMAVCGSVRLTVNVG